MDFPLAKFRLLYPAFAKVSDEVVLAMADEALCFVADAGCTCSEAAWMAVTAHMLALAQAAPGGKGGAIGIVSSASIDKVSVSFQTQIANDSWSYWLGLTPYGLKARALLGLCRGAGVYAGGLPERDAFTSVYGVRGGFRR